jgi:hypothetical protein
MATIERKSKKLTIKTIGEKNFAKFLNDKYGFAMSASGYAYLYKSSLEGNPVHVMHWSRERGDVFIRVTDGSHGIQVDFQINTGELRSSQWVEIPYYGDLKSEEHENFHIATGIRQEFRKSLGMF